MEILEQGHLLHALTVACLNPLAVLVLSPGWLSHPAVLAANRTECEHLLGRRCCTQMQEAMVVLCPTVKVLLL